MAASAEPVAVTAEGIETRMQVTFGYDPELAGVILAAPKGNMDTFGSTQVWEALEARLTPEAPSWIVDMRGVGWVTSAGIGILVRLVTHSHSLGGTVAIFGCVARVRHLIRVCALEPVLNVRDTREEARARLGELLGHPAALHRRIRPRGIPGGRAKRPVR